MSNHSQYKVVPKRDLSFHPEYGASMSLGSTRLWAMRLHGDQTDKSDNPYIDHLDAVAINTVAVFGWDQTLVTVAYLHDVVEDTDATAQTLADEGYSEEIINAVIAISKKMGEKNYDYLTRVMANPIASKVKLADLYHNTKPERLAVLTEATRARLLKKYRPAIWRLETALGVTPTVTFAEAYNALTAASGPTWKVVEAKNTYMGDTVRLKGFRSEGKRLKKVEKLGKNLVRWTYADGITSIRDAFEKVEYKSTPSGWTPFGDVPKYLGYNTIAQMREAHPELAEN